MNPTFAEHYRHLERWHWWFRGRQRILSTVLYRKFSNRTALSIASVGCGPAEGLAWLSPIAGAQGRIVGLDATPLHAETFGPEIGYVVGRLEAAPLRSAAFDVVLALDVLEHLEDDVMGIREAARLIKANGLLVVTVPALPSLWGKQDEVSHHKRRYTKQTLSQVFARAQLPRPDITYFNTLLFPVIAAIRWGRALLGVADQARSDFADTRPGTINEMLAAVFALERHLICRLPLPVGVSLLATVRLSAAHKGSEGLMR